MSAISSRYGRIDLDVGWIGDGVGCWCDALMNMAAVLQRGVATSYIGYTATVLSAICTREYMITVGSQTKGMRVEKTIRYVRMIKLAGVLRLEQSGELRTFMRA